MGQTIFTLTKVIFNSNSIPGFISTEYVRSIMINSTFSIKDLYDSINDIKLEWDEYIVNAEIIPIGNTISFVGNIIKVELIEKPF